MRYLQMTQGLACKVWTTQWRFDDVCNITYSVIFLLIPMLMTWLWGRYYLQLLNKLSNTNAMLFNYLILWLTDSESWMSHLQWLSNYPYALPTSYLYPFLTNYLYPFVTNYLYPFLTNYLYPFLTNYLYPFLTNPDHFKVPVIWFGSSFEDLLRIFLLLVPDLTI